MKRLLAASVLASLLSGCGPLIENSLPTIIPTGNPITDVLVSAAVQEGARYVAARVVPAVLDGTLFLPRPAVRRTTEIYDPRMGLRFVD